MSSVLGHNAPGRDLRARYVWVGLTMLLGLGVLALQLYRLQVVRHDEYTAKSVANFVKETRILADRGMIKDANGQILAQIRPSFDVFVTPSFCQKCDVEVLPRLGQLLGWDEAALKKASEDVRAGRRKAPFRPVAVRIDLSRDELDVLSAQVHGMPGVDVVAVPHRAYRTGTVLAHVLGYMNEISDHEMERQAEDKENKRPYQPGDFVGRAGLERSFESTLRGVDGAKREVVDARGQSIPHLQSLIDREMVKPHAGNNLVLSIDMRLQEVAEKAFPGVAGAVVAIDVRTGFIKALVSRPAFDPNVLTGRVTASQMQALAKDPLQPMIFRPTAQHYSPGSTFKVITTLAALRSGQFHTHSTATCGGGYRLGSRVWRCHLDHGHGPVDAKVALQKSCNTWYYKVADTLGLDPIAEVGKEFGLGQPTGIGVVGEVPGIMPTEAYYDAETAQAIAARRLKHLYTERGATFDSADPTWPFPITGFRELGGTPTRNVLDALHRYRDRAIQERRLPTQFPLPTSEERRGGGGAQPTTLASGSVDMEQAWTRFRATFQAQVPSKDGEIAALLAWAIEVGSSELDGAARFSVQQRDEQLLDVTLQPEGSQLLVALCNKRPQGGQLAKQMAEALKAATGKVPVFVRTTEYPSSVGTVVANQISTLQKKGGRRTVLSDNDLKQLVALQTFWLAHHTEPALLEWGRTTRPITRVRPVSDILGLERMDTTPPPASPPPTSRNGGAPSSGSTGVLSQAGAGAVAVSGPQALAPTGAAAPRVVPRPETTGPAMTSSPPPADSVSPPAPDGYRGVETAVTPGPAPRGQAAPSQPASPHETLTGPLKVGTQEGLFTQPIALEPGELTRHSAFLGGSGSGKTTAALNVLEQLLLRGIPAILVDRKGDLAAYAREEAWQERVEDGPLAERRRLLRERVDVALYTPGRSDGRPLAIPVIPRGLEMLPQDEREQGVQQAADAIAGMLEYKSSSRDKAARALLGQALQLLVQRPLGRDVTLEMVQQFVQSGDPVLVQEADGLDPKVFPKLGQDLAMLRLNSRALLSASGERLDIEELLGRGPTGVPGRTRLSIISTKFLGGTPSVLFWVSQLLAEMNRWASQHPSPELQAVLLFDEADLYLPAQSQPATKQTMENLLKRARSAGVGVMLATQSPGDLDYRCRENVRTWFVGRVKEDTALKKLKPMFTDARGVDITTRLAAQKTGQFHLQRDGQVQQLKADRNVILTEQLPEDEILRLARITLERSTAARPRH